MKPVGQKHVLVEGVGGECLKVRRKQARGGERVDNLGTWTRQNTPSAGRVLFKIRLQCVFKLMPRTCEDSGNGFLSFLSPVEQL